MRGWAALMVILSHGALTFFPFLHSGERPEMKTPMEAWIYDSPLAFVYSGTAAVCIFFALSGYILARRILAAPDVTRAATSMLVKRYCRCSCPA
ncbi:acyltransferase family protein [Crenobacter cavernae]|uniref:acyltransferase family protein n=1 Tax=Crenobacter cavernae TaxID=2290923 RepID=UPI0015F13C29|nr:acyltransferase family protein [Crenobacter cavernae]